MSTNSYKTSSQPDGPVIEEDTKMATDSKSLSEMEPQCKSILFSDEFIG
jgi:hypothetical protein